MFSSRFLFVGFTVLLGIASGLEAKAKLADRELKEVNILYLSSWNQDMPWQTNINKFVKSKLDGDHRNINFYSEYLDAARFSHHDYHSELKQYLRAKYKTEPDLVITQSDPATIFIKNSPDIFSNSKKFYVNSNFEVSSQDSEFQVLNVQEDFAKSISEAIRVTQATEVYIIGDSSQDDGAIRLANIRNSEQYIDQKVSFHYLIDLPFKELIQTVSNLGDNSVIFYALIYKRGDHKITPFEGAQILSQHASRPIFTHWDSLIGSGVLGGYLVSGEALGVAIYDNIDRFVSGDKSTHAKNPDLAKQYIYDWQEVVRWDIDANYWHEEVILENKPPSIYEQFKLQVILAALTTAALISLVVSLVVVNIKRKVTLKELNIERSSLEEKVAQRTQELKNETLKAKQLARTDPLTGLNNRRAFTEISKLVSKQSVRYSHPYCVLMIDIDHFKNVNDRYGHSTGDVVIRRIGSAIREGFRSTDIVGRIGGEEFSVILPETRLENATHIAEKLRINIECLVLYVENEKIKTTVSIGIAEYECNNDTIDIITKHADRALYKAKESGRNQLMAYSPQDVP